MSEQPATPFRAGFAALIGRPNVGKSTLLNALVGQKLSIVTPRPQTTRHRVLGLVNLPDVQIAFVDTPGLHRKATRALNKAMNRAATSAAADADVIVLVVEAGRWTGEDEMALERGVGTSRPIIVAVNKIDLLKPRDRLLPYIAELAARHEFADIVPVAARKGDNLERLAAQIARHLPESPQMFESTQVTDRDERFRIAESIREKLMIELTDEVPYGIAVEIESMQEEDGQLVVSAIIWVDREGQKPIVIGAQGERLKRIGGRARLELNQLLQRRLHLTLWVKVREEWADNAQALRRLGLE